MDEHNTKYKSIIMVGAYPPPLHGMAAVNEKMFQNIQKLGTNIIKIDISAKDLDRRIRYRILRIPKIIVGLVKLINQPKKYKSIIYISLSGGYGQLYEIIFLLLARLYRMKLFIHHHSFAYIDRARKLTKILLFIAGDNAAHIVLSKEMGKRLRNIYPEIINTHVISNAAIMLTQSEKVHIRNEIKIVGFLGNICEEKGIFEMLDFLDQCMKNNVKVTAMIAGPFIDEEVEKKVRKRLIGLQNVDYCGPVYGEEKEKFYDSIDVLLFPSRYINEAEPLTIHEAMAHSTPVIAYGIGCIPEIIRKGTGLVVTTEESLPDIAMEKILGWLKSPEEYQNYSKSAYDVYIKHYIESSESLNTLLMDMAEHQNI